MNKLNLALSLRTDYHETAKNSMIIYSPTNINFTNSCTINPKNKADVTSNKIQGFPQKNQVQKFELLYRQDRRQEYGGNQPQTIGMLANVNSGKEFLSHPVKHAISRYGSDDEFRRQPGMYQQGLTNTDTCHEQVSNCMRAEASSKPKIIKHNLRFVHKQPNQQQLHIKDVHFKEKLIKPIFKEEPEKKNEGKNDCQVLLQEQKKNTVFKEKQPKTPVRNSGGNNGLKDSSSTSGTDYLNSHKSQKALNWITNKSGQRKFEKKNQAQEITKDDFYFARQLGKGKFGTVNLVIQKRTGMVFALKILNKRKIINDGLMTQFIRELKIQSFINHSSIISNYGFFHDAQFFYIIMELGVDGQLYDIFNKGKNFTEEATSFIIGSLLDAVDSLHSKKIVHRDIKPENIVLVHGSVKLCDFGWAVSNQDQEGLRSTICGTPLYLSPQILKHQLYDEKVDLWAIGILAYELVFGITPFNVIERQDLSKVITEKVSFPSTKKCSSEYKAFIRAILHKERRQRRSCKELQEFDFIKMYKGLETCKQLV